MMAEVSDSDEIRALLATLRETPASERMVLCERAPPPWHSTLQRLLRGPDPDQALGAAARLPPTLYTRPFSPLVTNLLHQGSYPARLMMLAPEAALEASAPTTGPLQREMLLAELVQRRGDTDLSTALGHVRTREYLRLGYREIQEAPLEEVSGDLSSLASACIQFLLESIDPNLAEQVCVFGMGKLGGHELNFLSDIDLVFIHADSEALRERKAATRLHGQLRELVKHLEGEGPWRPLFRVDLRLRPFGNRGPLTMSISAAESYYERYGRSWERQVWLRARPVAGNQRLGEELLRRITPFVYRRSVTPAIFDEVSDMMLRARREARADLGIHEGVDVKLDAGGIREVEFFVQALQLLHGGKNASVRTPSTLEGLDRLLAAGLISDREHRHLTAGYRWLRWVEHRLQLGEGRQTHQLPIGDDARRLLAARLHAPGDFGPDDAMLEHFDHQLDEHRMRIGTIAQTLHGPSADTAIAESERLRRRAKDAVLDPGAPEQIQRGALLDLGVRDADEAQALLQHLYSRDQGPFAARGATRKGAQQLLLACLESADPDTALHRLVEFAARRPAHHGIWRLFAEPALEAQELIRLTAELFGSSEPLSRGLIGFPIEARAPNEDSVALLLESRTHRPLPHHDEFATELADFPRDDRGLDATLLRFKHRELVRIGLHDLGRRPDPLHIGRSLSDLADLMLEAIMDDLARDTETPQSFHLALFALGKYGMAAMDYGSDLDLMFVFTPASSSVASAPLQPRAIRVAQTLLRRLEDRRHGARLYRVDTRLRPSGRQGLLVSPLEGFRRYHAHPLPVWERLAMLRIRPVVEVTCPGGAPGATITTDVIEQIIPASLRAPLPHLAPGSATQPEVAHQVRTLKHRIERTLAREGRDKYNAKSGYGGCLELELLVAALQLVHGLHRVRGIVDALEGLGDAGIVSQQEVRTLSAIYRFQRLLLNRLRMTSGGSLEDPDRFFANSPRLVALARRMGLADRDVLLQRYLNHRETVRSAFNRHLPPR